MQHLELKMTFKLLITAHRSTLHRSKHSKDTKLR